ncbi:hypothetical protein Bequi_10200 [Brachybacterium sp. JHP9]|uniref:Methionine synthase n=1 Tax=Brachybacterium equifaecis TaxID=2910770 RepID=A0ABT0R2R0_9MICO|nr:hypothetical protein [Brachybacterium equifaecis]MCL6423753.1 hypothetical protein [Brachybacterium equifaecis]
MSALVTITGDGTFAAPRSEQTATARAGATRPVATAGEDPRLAAVLAVRSLLGDDLEEQVAARAYLPAALGTESADHLLPASLSLLAGTTGDLASYGWRVGPGAGLAWHRARELRERTAEAAQIGLLGWEGPLAVTALGPLTLAAATFLSSGERTLADRGALRDLPHLLADGLAGQIADLRERVPGARPRVLLREDAAGAVLHGQVRVPSGYRTYDPLPADEIGLLWRALLEALRTQAGLEAGEITLAAGSDRALLETARRASAAALAIAPARIPALSSPRGRAIWESLAEARDAGAALELVVDPARASAQLESAADAWHQLGFGPKDLAGITILAHRTADRASPGQAEDPAQEPAADALLRAEDLERVLRLAPAWAERVQG